MANATLKIIFKSRVTSTINFFLAKRYYHFPLKSVIYSDQFSIQLSFIPKS